MGKACHRRLGALSSGQRARAVLGVGNLGFFASENAVNSTSVFDQFCQKLRIDMPIGVAA